MVEETLNKTKTPSTQWDKIFANDILTGLMFKIYKELMQLNFKKKKLYSVIKNEQKI